MPVCLLHSRGSQWAPFIRLFQYGSTVAIFSNLNIIKGVIAYCVLSYLTPFWAIHIFEYPTDLACSWKTSWQSAEMNLVAALLFSMARQSMLQSGVFTWLTLHHISTSWLLCTVKRDIYFIYDFAGKVKIPITWKFQKCRLILRTNLSMIWHKVSVMKDTDSKGWFSSGAARYILKIGKRLWSLFTHAFKACNTEPLLIGTGESQQQFSLCWDPEETLPLRRHFPLTPCNLGWLHEIPFVTAMHCQLAYANEEQKYANHM